ncbi:MAG TPA: HDOD domain-containing protein [Bryobacteraceae bacterium]|nr:HDOD domain-containing protein [Bryobacteraceae bacterium]
MRFRIPQRELSALLPAEPGLNAHCRRVAALSREIATAVPLSGRLFPLLEQAALLHHNRSLTWDQPALDRLLRDVFSQPHWDEKKGRDQRLPEEFAALLSAFHVFPRASADREIGLAAEILAVANFLDEHVEFSAWDCNTMGNLSEVVEELGGLIHPNVREALHKAFRSWRFSLDTGRLPVQIGIIKELLALLEDTAPEVGKLAALAGRDPVIAASLVQSANSGFHGRGRTIQSTRQAIMHIGIDESRRLLLALAIRPIFASGNLRGIWRHSLWMAEFMEAFVRGQDLMDPEEALFLGLVHDVGRLAFQSAPQSIAGAFARLSQGGCPVTYTEQLLFGSDHAELGAAILSLFQVPRQIMEAVEFHHRPAVSDSPLAAALYLGEYISDSEEDLPSTVHLDAALARTQCPLPKLIELGKTGGGAFTTLLNVA